MLPPINFQLIKRIATWEFDANFRKKYHPLVCDLCITTRCNFNCIFCGYKPDQEKVDMSFSDFKEVIDDLNTMGVLYLYIGGQGETLLVKDIIDRISYAASKIPYVHLVTNGYLLDENKAKELSETGINTVSVSIDALEDLHDWARGKKGAFSNAIRAVQNLKKYAPKLKVCVASLIAPWNVKDSIRLMELCKKMKVKQRLQALIYYDSLKEKTPKEVLLPANSKKITMIEKVIDYAINNPNIISNHTFLRMIPDYYRKFIFNTESRRLFNFLNANCSVPTFFIYVDHDLTAYPCWGAKKETEPALFFKKDGLLNLVESQEYQNLIRDLRKCRNCLNHLYSCFLEPRMNFPLKSYLKYNLFPKLRIR